MPEKRREESLKRCIEVKEKCEKNPGTTKRRRERTLRLSIFSDFSVLNKGFPPVRLLLLH